jgi:5,10-methylenetetrahydromethanopterin reductase
MNPLDLGEVRVVAADAEGAGYDRVGIWDSPALYLDPWITLAAVSTSTTSLRIGTWVTNPLTRHPVVTANAAATLDTLAPGRVVIGIGTGDSGVYNLAGRAAPLDRLTEYVRALRGLLADGRALWEGSELSMRPAANPVPIWVAAHGARAIRTAGAVGDGVIFGLGIAPDTIEACRAMLDRGASDAGRDAAAIEAWYTAPWYVDDDGDRARDAALWHVASLAHHISRSGTTGKFIPDRVAPGIVELGQAYNLLSHGAPSREQRDEYRRMRETDRHRRIPRVPLHLRGNSGRVRRPGARGGGRRSGQPRLRQRLAGRRTPPAPRGLGHACPAPPEGRKCACLMC